MISRRVRPQRRKIKHMRDKSTVTTSAAYRNAPAAIEWLCSVFGFEKHAVYPGPDNTILHAELTLGSGMIMLGSVNSSISDGEYNKLIKQPDEIGGNFV